MSEPFGLLAAAVFCLALVIWQVRTRGWIFSPGLLVPSQWLVVFSSYLAFRGSLDPISLKSTMIAMAGIGAFTLGASLGGRVVWSVPESTAPRLARASLNWILLGASLIGLLFMFQKALGYVPLTGSMRVFGGEHTWYWYLRDLVNRSSDRYGLAAYALSFSYAATAYLVLDYRRGGRLSPAVISTLLSFGFAFLATGRTFLLLLACLLIAGGLPRERLHRLSLLLLAPVGVLLLFTVLPWLGGRLSADTVAHSLQTYFLGPLAALDWAVKGGVPDTGGTMTFRTLFAALGALGFDFSVDDLVQPWAVTRLPVNVYTVFHPYYSDFGVLGVALFLGALGGLHGWVFREAMSGHALMVVANGLLLYALAMQFFQDQYFSLLSQWFQIMGWTWLFLWLRPLPDAMPLAPGPGQIRV